MLAQTSTKTLGSVAMTRGVRVAVQPRYLPERSDSGARQFVFAYRIRVTNTGERPIRLLSRRWSVVDANGRREDVRGESIVGQQPRIDVGQSFEYTSFCPLKTPWGTMEGAYTAEIEEPEPEGETSAKKHLKVQIAIARFYLVCPEDARR